MDTTAAATADPAPAPKRRISQRVSRRDQVEGAILAEAVRLFAERALRAGILLAPGEFFSLGQPSSTWFRFNVAYAAHDALLGFLHSIR